MAGIKTCPVCRKLVSEDASWCPNCGTNLSAVDQHQPSGEQMGGKPEQQWQTSAGFAPREPDSSPENRLKEAVQWRYQTDKFINVIWAFLPLIGFVIGSSISAVAAMGVTDMVMLVFISMATGIISMALS